MRQLKDYEWVERFNGGLASVDDARSGCSSTVTCAEIRVADRSAYPRATQE